MFKDMLKFRNGSGTCCIGTFNLHLHQREGELKEGIWAGHLKLTEQIKGKVGRDIIE